MPLVPVEHPGSKSEVDLVELDYFENDLSQETRADGEPRPGGPWVLAEASRLAKRDRGYVVALAGRLGLTVAPRAAKSEVVKAIDEHTKSVVNSDSTPKEG